MRLKEDALIYKKIGQKSTIIKNISELSELGHTKVLNEYLHFPLSVTFAQTQLGNVILMWESERQLFDFFFRKPKQKANEESLLLANANIPIIRLTFGWTELNDIVRPYWGERTTKLSFSSYSFRKFSYSLQKTRSVKSSKQKIF